MSCHLTAMEREKISQLHFKGCNQSEIAKVLGRHKGTISRELQRNSRDGQYSAVVAQRLAQERRKSRPYEKIADHPSTNQFTRSGLTKFWSPEQIAGRIGQEKPEGIRQVSRQSICRWISSSPYREHWQQFLRRRGKRRPPNDRRGKLPGIVSISGRPEAANQRKRAGDWEGDTVISPRKKNGLLTMADRKSGLVRLEKLRNLKASTTKQAIGEIVKCLAKSQCRTATFDQGKEFADLVNATEFFPEGVFFAHAGCPWERGTNENTNGLIRQFIPKGTNITEIKPSRIKEIESLCNNRPRKRLGFRTPNEVFFDDQLKNRCA